MQHPRRCERIAAGQIPERDAGDADLFEAALFLVFGMKRRASEHDARRESETAKHRLTPMKTNGELPAKWVAALDDPQQHHDDGDDQEDVNQPSRRERGDHAEEPEDEQDDDDS
jgi:hypothetical protein